MPLWPVWKSAGSPASAIDLVQRVRAAVVREEGLQVGVELEALDAVLGDQAAGALDGVGPRRVDARERDQHVGVRGGGLGDLLVRDRRDAAARLPVDGEDDGGHAALAVVARRRRRRSAAAGRCGSSARAAARSSGGIGSCPSRESSVCTCTSIAVTAATSITAPPSPARPGAPRPRRAGPSPRPGAPISDTLTGSPLRRPTPDGSATTGKPGPVPVVRQREVVEIAERLVVAAAAHGRDDRDRRLDDRVDPVLGEPVAPGGRVLRAAVLAGDVLLGRHRPLLGVLEPRAVREAVVVAPVVEAAVVDEHLGEHEVEELGEHVEPSRRAAAARRARREVPRALARTRRRRPGRGRRCAARRRTGGAAGARAGGSTPASAASSGSQSRTVRVIGPGWSKVGAERDDPAQRDGARASA